MVRCLNAPHQELRPQTEMPRMLQAAAGGHAPQCLEPGGTCKTGYSRSRLPTPSAKHPMPLTRGGCAAGCAKQAGRAGWSGGAEGEAWRAAGGRGRSKGRRRCPKHAAGTPSRATAPIKRCSERGAGAASDDRCLSCERGLWLRDGLGTPVRRRCQLPLAGEPPTRQSEGADSYPVGDSSERTAGETCESAE